MSCTIVCIMDGTMLYCQRCGGETVVRAHDGRPRPVCERCGAVTYLDPKLAVAVVLQRDGKVLLGRRGPGARAAGKWSFPAGFVERGEKVEDAAVREVLEETGFQIELGELLGLLSSSGETVVLAVYRGTIVSGAATAGDDLTELGWFSADALPELAFPHDFEVLERSGQQPVTGNQ
ncbi:MAG: NUDIX domain-containing protein [Thermomicrobiales bacterium]|nr:NUDIX domain-containing protein [Thermomicrobiales bacterium]